MCLKNYYNIYMNITHSSDTCILITKYIDIDEGGGLYTVLCYLKKTCSQLVGVSAGRGCQLVGTNMYSGKLMNGYLCVE